VSTTLALPGRTRHRFRNVQRTASAAANSGARTATLAQVPPGEAARVLGYHEDLDPCIARRLCDLGLAPGELVTVVRRAPLRDPVVFRVAGYEIALRASQASTILVALIA
jgi:ferrous iron transport protein A